MDPKKLRDDIQNQIRKHPLFGGIQSSSRGDTSDSDLHPKPKPKPTIKSSAIKKCLNKIDSLYDLTDDTPYGQWLKECAELKAQLPALRAAGEAAQKILGIYYQSGRIRDTLNKLDAFTQQLGDSSNLEVSRIKGYHNYCFLMMHDVDALRKISIPELEPAQPDPETVEALLTEECAQMEFWKELPEARQVCQEMMDRLGRINQGAKFHRSDATKLEQIAQILKEVDTMEQTREMADRLDSMRNQNKALRENICRASQIQQRLLPVLTEDWFRRLNPEIEDNPINRMNAEELQSLYREALCGLIERSQ